MAFLIVAMGILLMLVGAVAVAAGAPIIQIERGWAEVISGSVAISGGAITFAIGVVLFRLQAWQHATSSRTSRPELPAIDAATSGDLRPTRAPDEPLHLGGEREDETAEPPSSAPAEHPDLWKRIPEVSADRNQDRVNPETATVIASGLAETADLEPDAPDVPSTVPASRGDALADQDEASRESAQRRLSFAPTDRSAESERTKRPSSFSRDWLSRPLLRARSAPVAPSEPPPLFAGPSDQDEDHAPRIDLPNASHGRTDDEAAGERAPFPSVDQPPEPQPDEPSIIGRYQAGSSTYTMFSNGAIDVETAGGDLHRFDSMADLKAFIARQESAVS